jgi:RNA polymerase sigma-70 factor (ECF subfamily)
MVVSAASRDARRQVTTAAPRATGAASPAAATDDVARFEALYEELFPYVWRSVQRLGVAPSAVDDVVQEVFVVVYRRLAEFEGRSSLKTWVYGIALRVAREHRRATRRKSPHNVHPEGAADPEVLRAPDASAPDAALAKSEAARLVNQLLGALDDDKREVFVLAELEQLPAPEIAEAIGVNLNTVYSRLRAARQEFAEAAARHRARDGWRVR